MEKDNMHLVVGEKKNNNGSVNNEQKLKRKRGKELLEEEALWFFSTMSKVLTLKVKEYLLWWCFGDSRQFCVLMAMLGFDMSVEEGQVERKRLFTVRDWLKKEGEYCVSDVWKDVWKRSEKLIECRLSKDCFMGKLFRVGQAFRSSPEKLIKRQKDFYLLYDPSRSYLEFDPAPSTSKGKYIIREEFLDVGLREEKIKKAGVEILDESFSFIPSVKNHTYHFEERRRGGSFVIGGVIRGRLFQQNLEKMTTFVKQLFTMKPDLRKEVTGKMCAVGTYINNRFCSIDDVPKDSIQYYVVKEKLYVQFPCLAREHQLSLEQYLHICLYDTMLALTVEWLPEVMEDFMRISRPYMSARVGVGSVDVDSSLTENLAYSICFTGNFSHKLHVDEDAITFSVIVVWNPLGQRKHFIIRSHKITISLEHGDIIYFRGSLLHGTEYTPCKKVRFCKSDVIVICLTINQTTGRVLQQINMTM